MNSVNRRKSSKKNMTFPIQRKKNLILRNNSDNLSTNPSETTEESPKLSHSKSILPKLSQDIVNKMQLLDELGFGSQLEFNKDLLCDQGGPLRRRFSIGITDFWTQKSRTQFLKEQGYEDALKKLKKNMQRNEAKNRSSLRVPALPHMMNSNTTRRNLALDSSSSLPSKPQNSLPEINCKGSKLSKELKVIEEKCRNFQSDSLRFKQMTERILSVQKDKNEDNRLKRKMTKQEKYLITSTMYSLV